MRSIGLCLVGAGLFGLSLVALRWPLAGVVVMQVAGTMFLSAALFDAGRQVSRRRR